MGKLNSLRFKQLRELEIMSRAITLLQHVISLLFAVLGVALLVLVHKRHVEWAINTPGTNASGHLWRHFKPSENPVSLSPSGYDGGDDTAGFFY